MIIAAVDPGNVSGIAVWWDPDHYDSTIRGGTAIDTAEVEGSTTISVLRRILDDHRPFIICVERFVQNPRKTHQPMAQQLVGAVKSLCDDITVRCVYQSPGPAKKIGSTATLKRLGWWTPTPDGHANSALCHVLLALATFAPERYARLIGL